MHPSRRLLALLAILALAAGLVLFDDRSDTVTSAHVVQAKESRRSYSGERSLVGPSGTTVTEASSGAILPLRERRQANLPAIAPFSTHDWTPPPPPPVSPPPPPPPQAPPLPFTYVGKQIESGQWVVFLANQDRTYTVKVDSLIESTYKVDKISPPVLLLTYIPLKQQQTLAIGSTE